MEFEDCTGKPRPERNVHEALQCLQQEMLSNPMALSKAGVPLMIHYVVVVDALRELLQLREDKKRSGATMTLPLELVGPLGIVERLKALGFRVDE